MRMPLSNTSWQLLAFSAQLHKYVCWSHMTRRIIAYNQFKVVQRNFRSKIPEKKTNRREEETKSTAIALQWRHTLSVWSRTFSSRTFRFYREKNMNKWRERWRLEWHTKCIVFIDHLIFRSRYVYNLGSMKFNKCNTKYINILMRMNTTTIAMDGWMAGSLFVQHYKVVCVFVSMYGESMGEWW